jgi:hypothetical protein
VVCVVITRCEASGEIGHAIGALEDLLMKTVFPIEDYVSQ